MEKWKKIKEAPRLEISDLGRVRWKAIKLGGTEFLNVDREPQVAINGSLYLPHRGPDGRQVSLYVHRLVAKYFLRKPRGGRPDARVGWIDGNKRNNAASNLYFY